MIQQIEKILEQHIQNISGVLCYVDCKDTNYRGIGKTSTLVKLSAMYSIPIIIHHGALAYKQALSNTYYNGKAIILRMQEVQWHRFPMILVDEDMPLKFYEDLVQHHANHVAVIGFINMTIPQLNIQYPPFNVQNTQVEALVEETDWRIDYQRWVDGGRK